MVSPSLSDEWEYRTTEPYDGSVEVWVIAEIRENATGEIREREDYLYMDVESGDANPFLWEEGTYSCDCNRWIFFHNNMLDDIKCSDGKFSVRVRNKKTGKVIYDEFGK